MNKNIINCEMQSAYDALRKTGIANEKGEIAKTFRGQISSFGAAITMGSLLPAIAFFSEDAGSEVSRSKLMQAILVVLKEEGIAEAECKTLFDYANRGSEDERKEAILNATIAIKLAMNMYQLTDEK